MNKTGFVRISIVVLVFSLLTFILSACDATQQGDSSTPTGGSDASNTTTSSSDSISSPQDDSSEAPPPSSDPDPSPTASPDEPSSAYFETFALLDSTDIPLEVGDQVHTIRSSVIHDMDGDGIAEAIFTIATYPGNMSHPIVVLNGDGPVKNIAEDIFLDGIPRVVHANQIFFIDIDNDNREDLLISEAGTDRPPWYNPDALIGIAINRGNGMFEDVSATVPEAAKGLRNYPLAAGDLYNDGVVRIILPSQAIMGEGPDFHGPDLSGLLFWNGSEFEFQQNWIDMSLWWAPENLYAGSFMAVQDLDNDGWQDLYISGSWTIPNHRVLYGSEDFPSAELLITLPEGPYGHTPWDTFEKSDEGYARGSDVNQVLFQDFDGDGDLDIVAFMEDVQNYKPGVFDDRSHPDYSYVSRNGGTVYGDGWLHVLRNDGDRKFVDVTEQGKDLGLRYYIALLPVDIDLDGDIDIVGQYWSKAYACLPRWGSTFFINEGGMAFTQVEDQALFPELSAEAALNSQASDCSKLGMGIFFPTAITGGGMKGLFVAPYEYAPDHPELRVLRIQTTGQFHIPQGDG